MSVKLLIMFENGSSRTETLSFKYRSWYVSIDNLMYEFVLNTPDACANACANPCANPFANPCANPCASDEIKNINDISTCSLFYKHTSDNKTERLKISQNQKNKELDLRRIDKSDKQNKLDKILFRLTGLEELSETKVKKLRDKLDIYIGLVKTHNQEIEKIKTTLRHINYEITVYEYSHVLERGKIQKISIDLWLLSPFKICWTIESDAENIIFEPIIESDAENIIFKPIIKHTVTKCNMML